MLASVLLGTEPPWLPTPVLVRAAALFDISEGTARTALSRMVSAGEAVAERGGYRLAGALAARRERQDTSRQARTRPWDGTWELVVVEGDAARSAADRADLRHALADLRLAELRGGLWARPDNLDPERSPGAAALAHRWCRSWRGAVPQPEPDVARLWDLSRWAEDAASLRADMERLVAPLEAEEPQGLAEGFIASAAVLRHLQADPLLPEALLPAGWPGAALRADYDRYDKAYRMVLRRWLAAA